MSTSPLRQTARRRPTRTAGEKSDEARVSNEKSIYKDGGNMAPEADGNLSLGKDSSQSKKIVPERDVVRENALEFQQANGRLVNRIHNNNQAVKKGARGLNRAKSPVRGVKPVKISRICKVIRILFKWLILLAALGAIGRGLWNWTANRSAKYIVNPNDVAAEGRVIELEGILKRTTKMLQVQLELVDIKYGKEVEGLKKDLEESIDEQAAVFYRELQNLKVKTSDTEELLLKLKNSGVLTRQEVLELVNYVVENWANEGDGQALSLDDVRAVAKQLVEAEIETHAADGLGRVDYALGAGGGRVVQHSEAYFSGNERKWGFSSLEFFLKSVGGGLHPYAAKVLEPSFGEPGQCLPLKGSRVFVVIALRTSIFAEAVTLEHVAKSVAYDRSSAPKDIHIFGWLDRQEEGMSEEAWKMPLLGEFTYDLKKSSAQTFNLPVETMGRLVNMIKLHVQSNHGSSSHTCIYRLRVHGKQAEAVRPAEIEA